MKGGTLEATIKEEERQGGGRGEGIAMDRLRSTSRAGRILSGSLRSEAQRRALLPPLSLRESA